MALKLAFLPASSSRGGAAQGRGGQVVKPAYKVRHLVRSAWWLRAEDVSAGGGETALGARTLSASALW